MKLKVIIPKGRMFNQAARLLEDAGIAVTANGRSYVPSLGDPEIEAKIMKPQNIARLVELGSHDIAFTGRDWVVETGARVEEIMDLGFDPVRLVAAVPCSTDPDGLRGRRIVVASEYERISRAFLEERGYDYLFIRTHGATEAYPPQDADMIIDNTSTGHTLREHGLKILAEIMASSTLFIAGPAALENPWKRERIEELRMLFAAVLNARERVMLEMNVPPDKLEEIVRILPCMRSPTVAPLHKESGYSVKAAVRKGEVRRLIPMLKKSGASDILEYEFRKVIL